MVDLNDLSQCFKADFALSPVVAAEIEFVLHGAESADTSPLWEKVNAAIPVYKIEKERGREQFEIALPPDDAAALARDLQHLKTLLAETAPVYALKVDFSAQPFADQPGNGLHIHVYLADASGKNVFYKDDVAISNALKHSIGGLLAWLPDTMPVFAPHEESYARFAAGGDHTPTTVSWGANNRTVAIRLPDSEKHNKRIEHRVAGADADPAQVIAAILAAMHWGLAHKTDPGQQTYGDASLPMYDLPKLPQTLAEARERMERSKIIPSPLRGEGGIS